MKLNFKTLNNLLLATLFLLISCNEKENIEEEIVITTGLNTGTETTNNESIRLDKVLSTETTITNLNLAQQFLML